MFGWFRRRREYRDRVNDKASRLIEALGDDAWPTIYRESRDLELPEAERLFHLAVRREVDKRLGIEPRTDVATRYTDQRSVVLLLAAVSSFGSSPWPTKRGSLAKPGLLTAIPWTSVPCASACTESMRLRLDNDAARKRVDRGAAVIVLRADLPNCLTARRSRCAARDRDHYGRIIAVCYADEADVNQILVREGLAWAYTRYSEDYVADEAEAQAGLVGIWQGEAEAPWDYRANKWERAAAEAPRPDCPIKGNINRQGENIYHTPWSPWYDRTQIDKSKGQRWFCDEAEAEAAGWRPARWR
jgi:hypothetical protein